MQTSLIDFLNHGILPFLGRSPELERIASFWRATSDAQRLRVFLLVGEAGIGKTRLVEETIRRVSEENGAVVHARLYPGAATAIAPLLAHALWHSGAGRRLLHREPEPTLPSVASSIRRMCRLRPTLLVIEDLHLLADESLADMSSLLTMLAEETVSVLCSTRPVEGAMRGVVERYLIDELRLSGLDDAALVALWQALFESAIAPEIGSMIQQTTLGNPLAIRSALRGAMTSGAVVHDAANRTWGLAVGLPSFHASLKHYVRLLSEGMAAHLSNDERQAVARLACLGELFARESASALIDEAPPILESLMFKGVIVTSNVARSPLSGRASSAPLLGVAHTLLHQQFAETAIVDVDRIARIIADELPLYSVLPFQALAAHASELSLAVEDLQRVFDRTLSVASGLDATREWELALSVWETASAIWESHRHRWPVAQRLANDVSLRLHRLGLLRRENHTADYAALVDETFELTDHPPSIAIAEARLHTLRHHIWMVFRQRPQEFTIDWTPIDEVLAAFPSLLHSEAYVMALRDAAQLAVSLVVVPLIREVERRAEVLLASDDVNEATRDSVHRQISIHLLAIFDTPEELQRKIELLAHIEASILRPPISFTMAKVRLLEEIGRFNESIATLDEIDSTMHDLGLSVSYYTSRVIHLSARAALGDDMMAVIEAGRRLCSTASEEASARIPGELGLRLACMALLRGDVPAARIIIDEFMNGRSPWATIDLLVALSSGDDERAVEIALIGRHECVAIQALGNVVRSGANAATQETAMEVRAFLRRPLLRISDLLAVYGVFAMLDGLRHHQPIAMLRELLADDLLMTVRSTLEWLDDRSLYAMMEFILDHYGSLLSHRYVAAWRGRIRQVNAPSEERSTKQTNEQLEVSMIGTIEIRTSDGGLIALRTGRLRTLLGVLVADAIIGKRLTQQEFWKLVAGVDGDERARKGTNLAVHRLREAMGRDVIVTGHQTPHIALDHVRVDVIDAHNHLTAAREGLMLELPVRAYTELTRALQLLRGDVIFPGLYDEFFEAAREDFEIELRSTIIDTAQLLLDEGDAAMAGEILRRGADALPGDDELIEMLRDALLRQGKHVEAARVKMEV